MGGEYHAASDCDNNNNRRETMANATIKFQRDPNEYKEVHCVVCGMDDLVMVEH